MAKKSQKNYFEWIIRDVWNLFPNVKLSSKFMIYGNNCNLLHWMPKDIYSEQMLLISLISPPKLKLSINYKLSLIDTSGKERFIRKGWAQLCDETVLMNIFQSKLKNLFPPNQKLTFRLSWRRNEGCEACAEIQKQSQNKQESGCSIHTREQATQTDVSQPLPTRNISTNTDMEMQDIKVYDATPEEKTCEEDTKIDNALLQEKITVVKPKIYHEMHDVVQPSVPLVTESVTNKFTLNAIPLVSECNVKIEESKIKPTHDENLEPTVSSIKLKEKISPFKSKIKKTKKKKDLNKRGKSKLDEDMELFLGMNEDGPLKTSPAPVSPSETAPVTPPNTTIIDSEILWSVSLTGDTVKSLQNDFSLSELPQNEFLTPVSHSTKTEGKENVLKNQSKIIFKYGYKKHQWSPLNPEGKKRYDRDFLLQLQSHPMSLCKPNNLPKLDIIKDKAHIHSLTTVQSIHTYGVSLSEHPQNEFLTPVSHSTKTEGKENVLKNQSKIIFKYAYKEDQWSPLNPEGKKQYDRDFLLQLQSQSMSLCKPKNLPKLDIIKDKAHIHRLTTFRSFDPLMPNYSREGISKSPCPAINTHSQRRSYKKIKNITDLFT